MTDKGKVDRQLSAWHRDADEDLGDGVARKHEPVAEAAGGGLEARDGAVRRGVGGAQLGL